MYQISCDGSILFDPRDEDLVLLNPRCKLEVNTVGEGSFIILSNHPCYDKLKKLKSIFEIRQDDQVIFRGRMTNDSRDFHNQLDVDLEGVLAFTNDSIIPPFNFPDDFPDAADATNMVEYFLRWLIENQHNGQVEDWQKLHVGKVTVTDPNNVITRSSESYMSTWEALKSKLFESGLGGYLCIRYEDDGNYIDYLESFEQTNTQQIIFGENLLDLTNESDASDTYSAILPLGADTDGVRLTLKDLPDGDLTDDLVKKGKFIYSKSAKAEHGWICVPVEDATWDDVTKVENLKTKAMAYLSGVAMLFSNTITINAVDLYFTDDQIQSFRIYQNILVNSPVHGVVNTSYPLTQLDIDIMNPQNTIITIGDTVRTLIDINNTKQSTSKEKVEQVVQQTSTSQKEIQTQLTYINEDTKGLQEHLTYVEQDVGDLQGQVDGLTGDHASLQEQVTTLSEDVVALQGQTTTLSEKDQDLQDQITALSEGVEQGKLNLQDQIDVLFGVATTIADIVTEVGTSDIWTFRKWSSGTVECWGTVATEEVPETLTYPVTFAGDPCIQITENNGKTHYYVIGTVGKEPDESGGTGDTGESGESTNQ